MILVVDASVAVKWFVREESREDALRLLDRGEDLCAPDLIVTEVAGIAWKKCIRGEIERDQAGFIAAAISRYVGTLHSSVELIEQALQIALYLNHSIYDCLYLACAEDVNGIVVTADRKLWNRVKGTGLDGRVEILSTLENRP
jgi:predicted nucleic acid-binding protein